MDLMGEYYVSSYSGYSYNANALFTIIGYDEILKNSSKTYFMYASFIYLIYLQKMRHILS